MYRAKFKPKPFERPKFRDLTQSYQAKNTEAFLGALQKPYARKRMTDAEISLHQSWIIQPKYDGRWAILTHEKGSMLLHVYSRHGKHIHTWRNDTFLYMPAFELHAEYLFGTQASLSDPLHGCFMVFDITLLEESLALVPLHHRLVFAQQIVDRLPKKLNAKMVNHFESQHITSVPYLVDKASEGVEGAVLKPRESVWGEGWVRIKPVVTMDYVIMGFNQSDSDKYKGRMIRSIKAGLYINGSLTHVMDVSGLTDEQRSDFYDNAKSYLGKVFTASGKSLFESGALRHPNFVEMHLDKKPHECVFSKDLFE